MAKHNYKKSRLKYLLMAFACTAACSISGIASACGNTTATDNTQKDKVAKADTQLLKNGNFEFFTVPEKKEGGNQPEYLIKTPENWSKGGTSSSAMSGIISTSKTAWDKMKADTLESALDINNKLDSSAADYLSLYVDYNGMKSTDILYKDQYQALRKADDFKDGEEDKPERKDRIENPGTHYNVAEKDGNLYTDGGNGQRVYVDDKGEYFLEYDESKKEYKQPISNILMLHNYATSHNGIAQNYSSVEIELPANTAAEISLWVKTSYLKFSQGKEVRQDRGANISVTQTVGSSSLDKFTISCINTEKLISEKAVAEDKYNGWVQYTVYVNACDFASSKIKLELGLGESGYTTEGYAFFDDVSVTKYPSLDNSVSYKTNASKLEKTTCNLSSDASEKVFKADSYKRNGGTVSDERFSKNFYYCIDLASEHSAVNNGNATYSPVSFASAKNLKAGYTVDKDDYVSSKLAITSVKTVGFKSGNLNAVDNAWRIPLKDSIPVSDDLLAYVTASATPFTSAQTEYSNKLNEALKGAVSLPKNSAGNTDNMLVMLSSYGAAYTASFDMTIPQEGYRIVSFWVKTSNMGGSTAATVKVTQKGNDDNTSQITLDTTDKVTNIGDSENEKNIFDGWVQCFLFVKNQLKEQTDFEIKFSFGNTTIKGADVHSFKNGWVALANMQTLDVDEKIFGYTGSGEYTASLTISEEAEKKTQVFDEAYANQSHEIKNDMVVPANYKGVNGSSSAIVNNGHVSIPFDEFNNNTDNNGNKFTGLINKESFVDGAYSSLSWYNPLLNNFNASGLDATAAWTKIFGTKSVQPLIINNKTRISYVAEKGATADTFKNYYIKDKDNNSAFIKVAADATFDESQTYYSAKEVMNYGYIGTNKEVAVDSYSTVSVRVKASENAIAYVYLIDSSADKNTLSFKAPSYSFYYDTDGNVLKAEPKANAKYTEQLENVLYSLRDDGLYQDKQGKLYANTWNYKKLYYVEDMTYVDKDGTKLTIDDLIDGNEYFNESGSPAPHYLVTSKGVKVYEYKDGNYHYIVDGKTQSEVVTPFETKYARYNHTETKENYFVEIKGSEHGGEWVTVTFVLHAGNAAKSYRLELWSGERDKTSTNGNADGASVIFDYSYANVSDDAMKSEYEQEIIKTYQRELAKKDNALNGIDTTGKNIAFYEELAKKYGVEINDADYKAHYYTFSLYDSADFVPFNKNVANEGATGYDYKVADQKEALAYLRINAGNSYTVFADYSVIDKSVTLNNPSTDDKKDDATDDKKDDGSVWLLASSIILVIAMLFAMVAILMKDIIKKARRNRVTSKNNYNQRKANRYKKKLGLQQPAPLSDDSAEEVANEQPEEDVDTENSDNEQ